MEKKSFRNFEAGLHALFCYQLHSLLTKAIVSIHDAHECEAKVMSIEDVAFLPRLVAVGSAWPHSINFHHGSARRSKHILMMCSLLSIYMPKHILMTAISIYMFTFKPKLKRLDGVCTARWQKKRFAPTSATFFADSMSLTKINS